MNKPKPFLTITTIEGRSSKPAKVIPNKDLQIYIEAYKNWLNKNRGVDNE